MRWVACRNLGPRTTIWAAAVLMSLGASRFALAETPLRETIDAEIKKAWEREKLTPAPLADDATFLRRISLDLCGIIPTYEETTAFLADADPQKRARLIDRLLESPRYAQHQADVWDMIYFGRNPPGYDSAKREGFQRWLKEAFAKNMPYDEMARALLRGDGNTAEQGPPMYLIQYTSHPEDAAMAVSQVFLGVQLQCARCHDHPYEDWKQRDFYGMAAFYARLTRVGGGKVGESEKIFLAEMNTGEVKLAGKAGDAAPGKQGDVIRPKFLMAAEIEEPDLAKEFKDEKRPADGKAPSPPKFSRKDKLAEWVAAPGNPYFAGATANRVWSQFMGRGLVHPVDNMSPSNKPTHPELLTALTRELTAHKYDLKWYIREIVNSRAYQLGDADAKTSDALPQWYDRARTRPLSAEELAESWRVATYHEAAMQQSGKKSEGRFAGLTWDYLRQFFGEPVTGTGAFQGGLSEHLYLNNGQLGQIINVDKGSLRETLDKSSDPWEARVDRLFLSVLNRKPTDAERTKFVSYLNVKEKEPARERLSEAIWTLLTCSEFRFNH